MCLLYSTVFINRIFIFMPLEWNKIRRHKEVQVIVILISNFRRVLNAVCFLLGNSPASEFYMPTFRNTVFHLYRWICVKNEIGLRNVGVCIWEKVWLENSLSQWVTLLPIGSGYFRAKPFPV